LTAQGRIFFTLIMRLPGSMIFCIGMLLTFSACKTNRPDADAGAQMSGVEGKQQRSTAKTKSNLPGIGKVPAPAGPAAPQITLSNELSGKVVSANLSSRFVVLDFYLSPMPNKEERLNVYRRGQKVGELKVSGPERNQMTVADIVAGEAQVGDEVRRD
jgi:hypothetical protein